MAYYAPHTYAACGECGAWATDERPLTRGVCCRCGVRKAIVRAQARRYARFGPYYEPGWLLDQDRGDYRLAWLTARERIEAARVAAVRGAA